MDLIRRPLVPIAFLSVLLSLLYSVFLLPGRYENERERLLSYLGGGVSGEVISVTSKNDGCELQVNTDHGRILVLTGAEGLNLRLGNMIIISGTEYVFRAASNPGQFDEKKYYRGEGFVLRVNANKIVVTDARYSVFKEALRILREKMSRSIEASFDEEKAGILKAMLLGDKSSMGKDIKDLYKRNGIAHILAISGLHISVFGNAIFMLLRKMRINIKVAGVISALLLLSYGVLTGFSVSTSRAVIMTLLSILALCIGRTYDMISGIAASCIIVLVINPGEVGQTGFLLSFLAAFGVAIFNEYIEIKNRMLRPFVFSAFLSAVTLPIIMCNYYEIPLMGVILNLVVIPSMSLLVPVGLLGAVLGVFGSGFGNGASLFLFGSVNYLLDLYDILCKLADKLPFSNLITGKPSTWRIVVYYLLLFLPVLLSGIRERLTGCSKDDVFRRKAVSYLPAFTALALLVILSRKHEFKVTMLDVGQGDAIVIENDNGNTYIVDCGSTSVKNVGEYRLIPFLKYEGVREVDALFYTHLDKDHISGGDELLTASEIEVKKFFVSDYFDEERADAALFDAGHMLRDGNFSLYCLYSGEGAKNDNDGSLVLLLTYKDFSMLLTGDISTEVEEKLLSAYPGGCDVDVLKVAHHGSKYSTSSAFLSWCKPEEAGISVSARNRYNHPHPDALARLASAGVNVRRTDKEGALEFWARRDSVVRGLFRRSR